jgi:hypothetical protein
LAYFDGERTGKMRELALVAFLFALMTLPSCRQDACIALRKQKLEINLDQTAATRAQLSKLETCGLDSVDRDLAFAVAVQICTEKMVSSGTLNGNNHACTISFGELFDRFNEFKRTPQYRIERNKIINFQR